MDEELMEKEKNQPIVKTRVYTPPTLTKYGKLSELTTGGTGSKVESNKNQLEKRP